MNLEEYASYDGLGLAELVANGQITAAELATCARSAIQQYNPDLNAVLSEVHDQAFAQDRPFTGVPFLIKELILTAEGAKNRFGCRAAPDIAAPEDSNLMSAFRHAGLQLIGTTQAPEMGYNATTEPVAFGPVHNPWKPGYSAGGSSGGSGAAVAAGIVPIAHGNDAAGSIRIPASWNGLVGLKPTRDRTPAGPFAANPLFGLAIEFAITRSVRDSAALLDCVAGPDIGTPHLIAPPPESFIQAAQGTPRKLTIAYCEGSLLSGVEMHPENIEAAQRAAELLEELGHAVVPCPIEVDFDEFVHHLNTIFCAFTAQWVEMVTKTTGCPADNEHFEAVNLACAEFGSNISALTLLAAVDYLNQLSRTTAQAFQEFDVLMSSTLATPPPSHGTLDQNNPDLSTMDWARQSFQTANNTGLFNITGQPAISLPLHWTPDHLPVGVQFAGHMGAEGVLLNLAQQLEQATGWQNQQARLLRRQL